MKTVTITEDQARAIMGALDIAVKAGGLNNARALLPVAEEIERQLTAQSETRPPSVPTEET